VTLRARSILSHTTIETEKLLKIVLCDEIENTIFNNRKCMYNEILMKTNEGNVTVLRLIFLLY